MSDRFRWAGWLAVMGWRARLYWVLIGLPLPPRLFWPLPGRLRYWGADEYVKAYMRWKAADYQPETWPR